MQLCHAHGLPPHQCLQHDKSTTTPAPSRTKSMLSPIHGQLSSGAPLSHTTGVQLQRLVLVFGLGPAYVPSVTDSMMDATTLQHTYTSTSNRRMQWRKHDATKPPCSTVDVCVSLFHCCFASCSTAVASAVHRAPDRAVVCLVR